MVANENNTIKLLQPFIGKIELQKITHLGSMNYKDKLLREPLNKNAKHYNVLHNLTKRYSVHEILSLAYKQPVLLQKTAPGRMQG